MDQRDISLWEKMMVGAVVGLIIGLIKMWLGWL
jgi:uncharacterized membrane-anchored protein YhcB (DUF1043 family)